MNIRSILEQEQRLCFKEAEPTPSMQPEKKETDTKEFNPPSKKDAQERKTAEKKDQSKDVAKLNSITLEMNLNDYKELSSQLTDLINNKDADLADTIKLMQSFKDDPHAPAILSSITLATLATSDNVKLEEIRNVVNQRIANIEQQLHVPQKKEALTHLLIDLEDLLKIMKDIREGKNVDIRNLGDTIIPSIEQRFLQRFSGNNELREEEATILWKELYELTDISRRIFNLNVAEIATAEDADLAAIIGGLQYNVDTLYKVLETYEK